MKNSFHVLNIINTLKIAILGITPTKLEKHFKRVVVAAFIFIFYFVLIRSKWYSRCRGRGRVSNYKIYVPRGLPVHHL
jgi:hypothetical protein